MKLYHSSFSPNCRKPRLVAEHLGIDLEVKEVNLRAGEQKQPEFLRKNPNGKVPVLEDGDFILWESNAIMCYLATHEDNDLWPKNNSRYDIMRWQSWEACHWRTAVEGFVTEYLFKDSPDDKAVEAATEKFDQVASLLNGHLEANKWLAGDTMTIADLTVAAGLSYKDACHIPVEKYGHLAEWFSRIEKLPAWKKTQPPQT